MLQLLMMITITKTLVVLVLKIILVLAVLMMLVMVNEFAKLNLSYYAREERKSDYTQGGNYD